MPIASLVAGALAGTSILYPFYPFAAVRLACLGVGLVIAGQRLRDRPAEAR
jgi:hypothetical protein